MSEQESKISENNSSEKQNSGETDALGTTSQVISKAVPPGADRRSFLMRSAMSVRLQSLQAAHTGENGTGWRRTPQHHRQHRGFGSAASRRFGCRQKSRAL